MPPRSAPMRRDLHRRPRDASHSEAIETNVVRCAPASLDMRRAGRAGLRKGNALLSSVATRAFAIDRTEPCPRYFRTHDEDPTSACWALPLRRVDNPHRFSRGAQPDRLRADCHRRPLENRVWWWRRRDGRFDAGNRRIDGRRCRGIADGRRWQVRRFGRLDIGRRRRRRRTSGRRR